MNSRKVRRMNFVGKPSALKRVVGNKVVQASVLATVLFTLLATRVSHQWVAKAFNHQAPQKVAVVIAMPSNQAVKENKLATVLKNSKISGVDKFEAGKNQVELTLSSDSFFGLGSANFKKNSQSALQELVQVIKTEDPQVKIEVEGHTDDSPIVKQKKFYRSNWELSAARATSMVHLFESAGFDRDALKVVGYGESRPLLPNRTPAGKVIEPNLAKNRRIVLRISL